MKNTKKEDVKSSKNEKKKKIIGIIFGILLLSLIFTVISVSLSDDTINSFLGASLNNLNPS